MAKVVGVWVDPNMEEIEIALLETRRRAVLQMRWIPLICPVCQNLRPAGTALAISGRGGYGYCSRDVPGRGRGALEGAVWSAGSGRRP